MVSDQSSIANCALMVKSDGNWTFWNFKTLKFDNFSREQLKETAMFSCYCSYYVHSTCQTPDNWKIAQVAIQKH
jgi:hypothetical protein